jgi:amino acid adenylation domain-containing protein
MQEQATAGFWLSPQQKFAWTLAQDSMRAPARAVCVVSLEGCVDRETLKQSLREVVSRHEILRTVFRRQTGMKFPFQVVLDTAEFVWEETDLSTVKEQAVAAQNLVDTQATLEIDLADGPPLRALLIKFSDNAFSFILSVPTLCGDARSLQVLVRELGLIYSGQSHFLTEPLRYVQFAQWQADLLESEEEDAREGRDSWLKQSESHVWPILFSGTKNKQELFKPERLVVKFGEGVASAILASSQSSALLLSTWEALLYRLSGQSAFSLGVLAENRDYEELENAIGCFARTLPLPARVENDFRFADVLRRTSESLRQAVAAQEYFLPEAIGTDGELISFADHDLGALKTYGGVGFRLERLQAVSERFKLRLVVVRRESEPELEFHYDASCLERASVERIAGYYQNLLAAALAHPDTLVSRLPLLSEKERQQLLVEWNQTASAFPEKQCLQELFEQQAARTPERLAIRWGEQALTYRELNERANQLAQYLRRQGVGPDRPVGLCLERSAESMVAVLAIVKAGGAYVPLNPDNPPARLKQQLEGAAAVITESKLLANLPEFGGQECPPHTIVLDREQQLWAKELTLNPKANTRPENLVYVIYTSGSTGVPKGVAVRHRNLVNYADFISQRLDLEKYPEGLQFATVSTLGADLGNTCIYPSLLSGGCLHIVPYEMATDPVRFAEYLTKHPVDVLKIVPSHLQALLQSEEAKKLLPKKYLITGGETLTPKLLEKIEALNPACEVLNHYGPTETTVGSLTLKLKDYDWKNSNLTTIPIGRPIQNTQAYVLDQNLEPVPIGVTGELYIAGAGVTAGYLGQAEKTSERFIRNPFVRDPEAKMYRTGDRARYLEDGNIEFLGRGDDQVKIRGFRIELGEIEARLALHAGIKQAVVIAREDEQGNKRLLAYVVKTRGSGAGDVSAEDFRTYLKQQLPDYMVPQSVAVLAKIPLNANGKIDRQALPEPEQAQRKTYVAPRTATERTIAEIWAEVLRREKDKIGIDDNFFDLGGHSLMATQVVSRLRERFSAEVPVRAMFDQPTISRLARIVDEAQAAGNAEEMSIVAVSREAYRG